METGPTSTGRAMLSPRDEGAMLTDCEGKARDGDGDGDGDEMRAPRAMSDGQQRLVEGDRASVTSDAMLRPLN
ncbi:hypothetical protein NL676_036279 [Syzygium grande]|nr:hypothetical protein NL676_036279 [Syzygium grande]